MVDDGAGADLFDTLADGVVLADENGVVTHVNDVAAALLGAAAAESRGRPLEEVLALQDQQGRRWAECTRPFGGLVIRRAVPEQVWLTVSGEEVLVTARIHRGADRRVTGVAVGLRGGRGRARLDRERSDLVATVAHELRSPLTGVKGFVQAMLNRWEGLNEEQKKLMLQTVNADADRLSRLIVELLDVARIDTGRLQLYPRPVDALELVQRVVDSVAAGTAREIGTRLAETCPRPHADPDKLTQVVTNLVENGVRHGAGVVTVTLDPLPPGGPYPGVRLVVEDEGEGIPPEIRRRVFTKFWTHGMRGGSGLGMYIVHGLVRAHGGSVEIGDAEGGGARIEVAWPSVPRRRP